MLRRSTSPGNAPCVVALVTVGAAPAGYTRAVNASGPVSGGRQRGMDTMDRLLHLIGVRGTPTLGRGQERVDPNEPRIAHEMVDAIKQVSLDRHPTGVVKRFNQGKSLACLEADFHVPDDLPDDLRRGLFALPGHYHAKIRFANASTDDDRRKDLRGMSIMVHDVPGDFPWGEPGIQSFLLNSEPALFAGTPERFLAFVEATRAGRPWQFFVDPRHVDSLRAVMRGRKTIASPLDIRYWSTTPFRYGDDESVAVKFSVRPTSPVRTERASSGPDRLSEAIAEHLRQGPASFDFMVQFQDDPARMPIENASIVWNESRAPFRTVARITIENQDFRSREALAECERMTFSPWQSLAEHRPLGGINRVRKAVYAELGRFRNAENDSRLDAVEASPGGLSDRGAHAGAAT